MYYLKLKSKKFMFEIKCKGFPSLAKAFTDPKMGRKWAAKVEMQIESNEYEDLSITTKTGPKHVLIKYINEITKKKDQKKKH